MKRSGKRIDGGIIVLVLICAVIVVAVVVLVLQLRTNDIAEAIRKEQPIVIGFLVSEGEALLCTEVFIYHPGTAKGALFDIPGEWGDVLEESDRMDRIDRLYRPGEPEEYLNKVSELLEIEIRWSFEMSLDDVERAVDLFEGLELFIANPVEIISDEEMVLLPSGSLVLDGAKTREYLSFDDPEEPELDRRGRYQKFVQAFLKKIGEHSGFLTRDEVFPVFRDSLSANMSDQALRSLILELADMNAEHLVPKHVHGDRVKVDDQTLLFPHLEGKLIRETARQTLESLSNLEVLGEDELTVILEVLNGTDKNGLASRTAQLFSDFGYDVLPPANADRSDHEHTVVISNSGDLSKAQQIANLIRCSRVELGQEEEQLGADAVGERADVTIILGMDFDGRYCKE